MSKQKVSNQPPSYDPKESRRRRIEELTAKWTPERIAALFDAMGATQEEIADRLLCKQGTVSLWCNGRVKPRNMALAWLDQLEIEVLANGYLWNEKGRLYE